MARYVVVLGPSHGPLLFHTEYRILPSLPCTRTYIYPIPLTQSNMFWQRHEFAVFSKETTVAGRYIYIYHHHRSSNLLSLLFPPSKTLIPGRIKVFGTKLHRESSIHAGMFLFFLVCSSNFSLAFPSPLVNYLSLPLCFCVWLHIVAHSERSP